jgi:hypothetical protein
MLSWDLGYGRLARPRQVKVIDEIQKENNMKNFEKCPTNVLQPFCGSNW